MPTGLTPAHPRRSSGGGDPGEDDTEVTLNPGGERGSGAGNTRGEILKGGQCAVGCNIQFTEKSVSEHAAYVEPAHHYLIQVCGDLKVSTIY